MNDVIEHSYGTARNESGPKCWIDECKWFPDHWYIERMTGLAERKLGMCFGHATVAVYEAGRYGRRVRKVRP